MEILQFFKNLLVMTENMVAARQVGNWDSVDEIAAVRLAAIRSYQLSAPVSPPMAIRQEVSQICEQIQLLDQEILQEAIEWRAQIKQFLIG